MSEQLQMNALRIIQATQMLDKSMQVLGEMNMQRISGMTRQELADYRASVREARDHITIARKHLVELEKARKARSAKAE